MSGSLTNTLQHLSEAAKIVDSDNRTKKLLQCYYLSRIQRIAESGNISLENDSYSSCIKCLTPFSDSNTFTLTIKPRKICRRKHRKLVTNLESKRDLSISEKYFAKKYQKLVYNVAEITCKLCNRGRKSNIRFDIRNKDKPKSEQSCAPPSIKLSELELVKPKKRKRDKSAGLIIKDKVTSSTSTISTKPILQPMKVIQVKSKTNNAKTAKNSTGGGAKTKQFSFAQKQRKGILLLANVLKMNDQRQQDSSQMKLSKMFK